MRVSALVASFAVLSCLPALASEEAERPAEPGPGVTVRTRPWEARLSGCRSAYLPSLGVAYVFGGNENRQTDGKLDWRFDATMRMARPDEEQGLVWMNLPVQKDGPGARSYGSLTMDLAAMRLLSFGGFAPEFKNDLWSFDLSTMRWQVLHDGTKGDAPQPRDAHVACMGADGKELVLFGGLTKAGAQNDLWRWQPKDATWHRVEPAEGAVWPAPRFTSSSCRIGKDKLLVIGGFDAKVQPLAETWSLDLASMEWTRLADLPTPLSAPGVVWHERLGKVVVCGGSAGGKASDVVFLFDPKTGKWEKAGALAEPVAHSTAVYDGKRDVVLLFGGTVGLFVAEHPEAMVQEVRISGK